MSFQKSLKTKQKWLISIGISVGLLFYLFGKVNLRDFLNEYQDLNYYPFIVLPLIMFLTIFARGARWKLLLGNDPTMSSWELTKITILGFFANFVLPLRAGELIRPWLLRKKYQTPYIAGLTTVVSERAVDILALLMLFGWSVSNVKNIPSWVNSAVYGLGSMAILICFFMVGSILFPNQIIRTYRRLFKLFFGENYNQRSFPQKLESIIESVLVGLSCTNSIGNLLMVFLLSGIIWVGTGMFYQTCLAIFNVPADFIVGQLVNVIISLAVAAPSAPGFIGTFQLGCVVALHTITGYAEEFALAYSVLAHSIQYFFIVGVGLIVMTVEGFKFKQLAEKHSEKN
jgi:glycosyltransferase 2 family protein